MAESPKKSRIERYLERKEQEFLAAGCQWSGPCDREIGCVVYVAGIASTGYQPETTVALFGACNGHAIRARKMLEGQFVEVDSVQMFKPSVLPDLLTQLDELPDEVPVVSMTRRTGS